MIYKILHNTTYEYEESVDLSHNQLRLRPRNCWCQKLLKYDLKILPPPSYTNEFTDFYGNNVDFFSVQVPQNELIVVSESIVERNYQEIDYNSLSRELTLQKAEALLQQNSEEINDARQYIFHSKYIIPDERIQNYAKRSYKNNRNLFEATKELIHRIYTDFSFVPGFTTIATPLEKVFEERKGVCQDFAHFAIACIRSVGLPARYVSGYIETIPPKGKIKLTGSDASHAWFSIFLPTIGWIDFDPTNNLLVKNQHVTIGWGTDYFDIIPVKGVMFSYGKSSLKVSVDMNSVEDEAEIRMLRTKWAEM